MHGLLKGAFGASLLALLAATAAQGQVGLTSNTATVTLNATKNSTLTVSPATSTATLASITDGAGVASNGFSPVNITTAWNLTSGTSVNLVGWFAVPAQALANGSNFIPSSKVQGRMGATPFAAFNNGPLGSVGVANGSLILLTVPVGAGTYLGNRTDQLDVALDLAATTTVAGNYTGTLNLQAIVQ